VSEILSQSWFKTDNYNYKGLLQQLKYKLYLSLFLLLLFFPIIANAQLELLLAEENNQLQKSSSNEKTTPAKSKPEGCTLWFQWNYRDCCVQHDRDYRNWYKTNRGWRQRLKADNNLFTCVTNKGIFQKALAPVMRTGVRIFGSPLFTDQKGNFINSFSKRLIRLFRKSKKKNQNS
jgi:hypothetical protein